MTKGREETPLLLASASEARAGLLRSAGVKLALCPSDLDEEGVKIRLAGLGHGGRSMALRLAEDKALDVSCKHPASLVLAGDQTLSLGLSVVSKSAHRSSAALALTALAGRTHALHSAYAFARRGRLIASGLETARLRMRSLDRADIEDYLDRVDPSVYRSVGVYQIEALGRELFTMIEGDQSTILGLPLDPVLAFLRTQRPGGRPTC